MSPISIAGGSINRCVRWETDAGPAFVKIAAAGDLGMLEAEAEGLRELQDAAAVRVPRVLAVGAAEDAAVLALEWIEFGAASTRSETQFGRSLARLHRVTAPRFGWHRDNTIGRTPQHNDWDDDWPRFFAVRRLGFQLRIAAQNGLDARTVDRGLRLAESCGSFFATYRPRPSLLHGDLWGGNWGAAADGGEPVIFDPAVYFGDREADLAMTRLFGGGYGAQAASMIERLLAGP